ncbi:crossover junction endodeoxyribonuclease RuvC [Candidatus Babeliales bacterium]|nr:crossover junction endodeoxyribonuclease RuvC [Candidatus Babeliales bacterium]
MLKTFLGIDPGFHVTGYAIIKKEDKRSFLIDCGYLQMSTQKHLSERVGIFHDFFEEKIKDHSITDVVLETSFLYKNAQTFLKLGYLRGILYLLANKNNLNLIEFAPREIKQAVTGFGGASKEQVASAVLRMFPKLSEVKITAKNDVTDALAVCMCGLWQR